MVKNKAAVAALSLIAITPIVVSVLQMLHFATWLFEWEYSPVFKMLNFSFPILAACFVLSLYEHFCTYYRIVILSSAYLHFDCFFIPYYPSILFYNITNIIAIAILVVGLIGCLIHFAIQIKDFFRYVRTKQQRA